MHAYCGGVGGREACFLSLDFIMANARWIFPKPGGEGRVRGMIIKLTDIFNPRLFQFLRTESRIRLVG